jgi:hypothetical protein
MSTIDVSKYSYFIIPKDKSTILSYTSSAMGSSLDVAKTGDTMTGNLTINSSLLVNGNVGIETTVPTTKFQIYPSTEGIDGDLILLGGNGYDTKFGMDGTGAYLYENVASRNFSLGANSARNQLVLDGGGNVGIGTTLPGAKLDVRGNIDLPKYNDWSYIKNSSTSGGLKLGTANSGGTYLDSISISSGGNFIILHHNIGIKKTSPTQSLDVSGNIVASGDIIAYAV